MRRVIRMFATDIQAGDILMDENFVERVVHKVDKEIPDSVTVIFTSPYNGLGMIWGFEPIDVVKLLLNS